MEHLEYAEYAGYAGYAGFAKYAGYANYLVALPLVRPPGRRALSNETLHRWKPNK